MEWIFYFERLRKVIMEEFYVVENFESLGFVLDSVI